MKVLSRQTKSRAGMTSVQLRVFRPFQEKYEHVGSLLEVPLRSRLRRYPLSAREIHANTAYRSLQSSTDLLDRVLASEIGVRARNDQTNTEQGVMRA